MATCSTCEKVERRREQEKPKRSIFEIIEELLDYGGIPKDIVLLVLS